jgi:hypothetical protein
LSRAVDRISASLRDDAAAGRHSVVWFFFSGHGQQTRAHEPALALLDKGLTQPKLYALLDRLPADLVHVLVDACHADAVVRMRGAPAKTTHAATKAADIDAFANRKSLARYANVGAVIASAVDQPSHEWSAYENGVFTHQLLSALRGGADVNADGRIEYSELHAFLGAANREVHDARARLSVLVRAPPIHQRAALVDFSDLRNAGRVSASGAELARFWIEDARGVRLADVNREPSSTTQVALPSQTELFLRTPTGEATFSLAPEQVLALSDLHLQPASVVARGAIASALSRGLFAAPYGPIYYRGFVDSAGDVPVEFASAQATAEGDPWRARRQAAIGLWVTAGAAAAGSAVFVVFTANDATTYNRAASTASAGVARTHYATDSTVAIVAGGVALAALGVGLAIFPWSPQVTAVVAADAHGISFAAAGHF